MITLFKPTLNKDVENEIKKYLTMKEDKKQIFKELIISYLLKQIMEEKIILNDLLIFIYHGKMHLSRRKLSAIK